MKSTARLFRVVDKLFELLPPATGFEPYSLVAFAYGDEDGRENLRRSFRYEVDGCCTHLTVEAPFRSPWRRRMLSGLAQAGYEPWLSGKESADVRRWLRTSSERRRELRLLEELGANGAVEQWPSRAIVARPRGTSTRQRRWSRAHWARVVDETREARAEWDDLSICFSRFATRPAATETGAVAITVGLLTYWWDSRGHGKTILVFASVNHAANPYRGDVPLPSRVAHVFRAVLREAGFEPDGARSVADGKRLPGRVGFEKRLSDERLAVQTCVRIYDALVDVPIV